MKQANHPYFEELNPGTNGISRPFLSDETLKTIEKYCKNVTILEPFKEKLQRGCVIVNFGAKNYEGSVN